MALRSTKAVGTIATIQLMSQMAPLDIRGTAESQSVIGRLGVFAPPSSRRSASGAVSGSVDCRALGGCSAGTSLRRSPRGVLQQAVLCGQVWRQLGAGLGMSADA